MQIPLSMSESKWSETSQATHQGKADKAKPGL